jgi:hypothetical protein
MPGNIVSPGSYLILKVHFISDKGSKNTNIAGFLPSSNIVCVALIALSFSNLYRFIFLSYNLRVVQQKN